jgi:hypothetical protein
MFHPKLLIKLLLKFIYTGQCAISVLHFTRFVSGTITITSNVEANSGGVGISPPILLQRFGKCYHTKT